LRQGTRGSEAAQTASHRTKSTHGSPNLPRPSSSNRDERPQYQLARRYRRSHLRAAEQAFANAIDVQLGRAPDGPVTLDFDSTGVEVYGRNQPGAGVNDQGQLVDQPLLLAV
jgi:hypothetical protein